MNRNGMTWFQHWILRRICKKLVIQGPSHQGLITEYYRIMRKATEVEFTEDNRPTHNSYLTEWHKDSLEQAPKH